MHDYVTKAFLLVSSSVRSKQLLQLCFVLGQGQNIHEKHTTKNSLGFHNPDSPLLTILRYSAQAHCRQTKRLVINLNVKNV